MTSQRRPSPLVRRVPALGTLARSLGILAVLSAAGMAAIGAPVEAQVPTLPPITLPPPDPSAPSTTTSTLLPPLVPTENLLPAPDSSTPPPSILPLPTTAPSRRTTDYKPPPVPPSTPRAASTPARSARGKAAPPTATSADHVEGAELGEVDNGYGDLPFDAEAARVPAGDDTMELGIEASARNQVGTMASFAAGLIALVLFGVALWFRSEARRLPDPFSPL